MKKCLLLFLLFLIPFCAALAQEVSIDLGKSPVPIDEYFTISVTLKNQELKSIGKFPELEGFEKSRRFSSTTTNIINGQVTVAQTVTQNYAALKEGEVTIKPFTIMVNEKPVESDGAEIVVGPPAGRSRGGSQPPLLQGFGLLDELFGAQKPQEFIDKKEDAFLVFNTEKQEAYVGEGVSVNLAFYVARDDQNLLDFHDFLRQISAILKKLKPANAWEETFEQTGGEAEIVTFDDKEYLRFKLYEAVYYPLNDEPLLFPSVGLEMIKYRLAKEPGFLGNNRQATRKTYYTAPKIVNIKQLPDHPLRDAVPVGNYRLNEYVPRKNFVAGKSFTYAFEVEGEGNLAVIKAPEPEKIPSLDLTLPNVKQNLIRQNGRVFGQKSFRYFITPRAPGSYDLSRAFSLIFFNPETSRYDTLRSEMQIEVAGVEDNDAAIKSKDPGAFYGRLQNESNDLISLSQYSNVKLYTNLVVLFLLLVSLYLFYQHRL